MIFIPTGLDSYPIDGDTQLTGRLVSTWSGGPESDALVYFTKTDISSAFWMVEIAYGTADVMCGCSCVLCCVLSVDGRCFMHTALCGF